jgi:hypothetical protein
MHILLLLCLTAANVFIQLFYFEESFLALFRAFLVLFVIFASAAATFYGLFVICAKVGIINIDLDKVPKEVKSIMLLGGACIFAIGFGNFYYLMTHPPASH